MSVKTAKILFWIATIIIFIMEGVMPAFTSQTEMAKAGMRHLGYPEYFGLALVVFKVLGALILIIPKIPGRLKDMAYAGFFFDFTFASISYFAVDGVGTYAFFPWIFLVVLFVSWYCYHKVWGARE